MLVPGGVLLAEVPVAAPGSVDRAAIVEAARALPNAVQAAPTFEELLGWLAEAGFSGPTVRSERPLSPEEGSTPTVPPPPCPATRPAYRLLSLEVAR